MLKKISILNHSVDLELTKTFSLSNYSSSRNSPFFLLAIIIILSFTTSCQTTSSRYSPINLADSQEWFIAAKTGNISSLIQVNVKKSIPWDFKDKNGVTALMLASRYGHLELIQFLLDKNVAINQIDIYGYNALSYAVFGPLSAEKKEKIATFLILQNADAFQEDHIQNRPLFYLIENGYLQVLQKITWSQNTPCDKVHRLGDNFSLITYSLENDQPQLAQFFRELKCP